MIGAVHFRSERYRVLLNQPISLTYDRTNASFGLLADLIFCQTVPSSSFDLRASPVEGGESRFQANFQRNRGNLSHDSLLELVPRQNRFLQGINVISSGPVEFQTAHLESLDYDPTGAATTLENAIVPLSMLIELDFKQGTWNRLEVLSVWEEGKVIAETDLRRIANLVVRSPCIKRLAISDTACTSQHWHPLVFLLRLVAAEAQGPSTLEKITIHADQHWVGKNRISQDLRDLAAVEVHHRFPHLTSVDCGYRDVGMHDIATLLTEASGAPRGFSLATNHRWVYHRNK